MSRRSNKQQKQQMAASVHKARSPSNLTYDEMSELGRDLFDMSREYAESGGELLSEEEIEIELARRRGGYAEEDAP